MYVTLDDIALLRINPELRYDHRVSPHDDTAVRLFTGNASEPRFRPAAPQWVRRDALQHPVEVQVHDIIVCNRLIDNAFHVFSSSKEDAGTLLSVHYTKVMLRSEDSCPHYAAIALRAALHPVARRWQHEHPPLTPLDLRSLRELRIYWPAVDQQQQWVQRYADELVSLRRQQRALRAVESALLGPEASDA